ncbi:unnamed protein product, partial [Hydatigera taeniaeformis]|uniref:Uncharacterized protein n=1 Tax=Hydatigena taeniaeformis TaxID=6205 RepID=A0A0R3WWI3_HYDTA
MRRIKTRNAEVMKNQSEISTSIKEKGRSMNVQLNETRDVEVVKAEDDSAASHEVLLDSEGALEDVVNAGSVVGEGETNGQLEEMVKPNETRVAEVVKAEDDSAASHEVLMDSEGALEDVVNAGSVVGEGETNGQLEEMVKPNETRVAEVVKAEDDSAASHEVLMDSEGALEGVVNAGSVVGEGETNGQLEEM